MTGPPFIHTTALQEPRGRFSIDRAEKNRGKPVVAPEIHGWSGPFRGCRGSNPTCESRDVA